MDNNRRNYNRKNQQSDDLEYVDLDALSDEDSAASSGMPGAKEEQQPADTDADLSAEDMDSEISFEDVPAEEAGRNAQRGDEDPQISIEEITKGRQRQHKPQQQMSTRRPAGNDRHGSRGDDQRGGRGGHMWVQIILAVAIAAIALTAVLRYRNWARGEKVVINPDNADKYSVEVNDNMVLLPQSKLEGHEDDGVTTILCLGDAPFADDSSSNGLAAQISALSGATTINAAFPNSQVTCVNRSYDPSDEKGIDDIFNLFYVCYAISINDYTSMETVARAHTEDPQYLAAVQNLENTDFSKVDIIAIMYDGIDYENDAAVNNPNNEDELVTYTGAMRNAFKLIQDKYPYIRIVFMSPTYMLMKDSEGNYKDGRTDDIGNGTLIQYWQYAYDTCGDCGVSFLDNYYGSVNDSNYQQYLTDNIHLNNAGRIKVADHFVYKVINNEYAEYDANSLAVASTDTTAGTAADAGTSAAEAADSETSAEVPTDTGAAAQQ